MQAMTQTADKVSEKAVPVTEQVAGKIEDKAAQVQTATCLAVHCNAMSMCCADCCMPLFCVVQVEYASICYPRHAQCPCQGFCISA